jgi:hypothetical protein
VTDDQDVFDWKRDRGRRSPKQLQDRETRRRRELSDELQRRYEQDRPGLDDLGPPPRVD